MYKIKNVVNPVIFIIIGACSFALTLGNDVTPKPIEDININNTTAINDVTSKPIEDININNTTAILPVTLIDNVTVTTATPANTTSSPITTTTILPPSPNTTTITPNVTTTVAPNSTTPIPVTTVKPTAAPSPTPIPSHRRFDGPSFIGGIVLALGMVAIGFVAFKFYKARTELNYHTL